MAWRRVFAWVALTPLVFLGLFAVGALTGGIFSGNSDADLIGFLVGFGIALCVPWLTIGRGPEAFGRIRSLKAVLREDRVLLFEGNLRHAELVQDWLEANADKRVIEAEVLFLGIAVRPDEPLTLAVLGETGEAWEVNGYSVEPRIFLPLSYAAPTPEESRRAANWALRVSRDESGVVDLSSAGRRPLSPEELAELESSAVAASSDAFRCTLKSCLYLGGPNFILWIGSNRPLFTDPLFWFLAVCLAAGSARSLQLIQRAVRWRRDVKEGAVLVARLSHDDELMVPRSGAYVEVLIHTRLEWTRNGQPSDWRAGMGEPNVE